MSKKTLISLTVILTVLLVGSGVGYMAYRGAQKETTGTGPALLLPSLVGKKAAADLDYEDASGFSFKYPKDIKIADVTAEDEVHYSLLELTEGKEKLVIRVKDTDYKKIDEWLAEDTDGPSGRTEIVGSGSLAGAAASQYTYLQAGAKRLLSVAIDRGVVYVIDGPADGGYWEETQNIIVSTFVFGSQPGGGSTGGEVIYEAEEVIE